MTELFDWGQLILSTLIATVAYFLKTFKSQLKEKDSDLQDQIDEVTKDLNKHKLETAERFVQKDDFIRATAVTDRKLDKIYDELMKLNKSKNVGEKP